MIPTEFFHRGMYNRAEADRVRRELDGAVCSVFQGAFTGTHFSFNDLVVPLEDIKAALLLQQSPNGHQVSLHPWSGVLMLSAQVRRKVVPKDSSEGMGLTPAEMELLFDEVNSFLHIDLSPELASSVWSNVVPLAVVRSHGFPSLSLRMCNMYLSLSHNTHSQPPLQHGLLLVWLVQHGWRYCPRLLCDCGSFQLGERAWWSGWNSLQMSFVFIFSFSLFVVVVCVCMYVCM